MVARKKKQTAETETAKPRRIAVYVRVSSVRQAMEGDSIAAQQAVIDRFIEMKKLSDKWDIERVELYVEPGKSGKTHNRPAFQRLLGDVKRGKINTIIAVKLDRVSRSARDFLNLWHELSEDGVELYLAKESFDLHSPYGKLILTVLIAVAELERENISERTHMTMADRAERGLSNGPAPIGYSKSADGKLTIDDGEVTLVRRIYDWFEELGSAGAVVRELAKRGIKTPVRTMVQGGTKGGQPFKKQQVVRILENPVYVGTVEWGDSVAENAHEAIITAEQFARVGNRLEDTRSRRRNFRRHRKNVYPLTGLLHCECGAHMVGACYPGRSRSYRYYICTRQSHEGTKASCQARRLPAHDLEMAVFHRLVEISQRDDVKEGIIERAALGFSGRRDELADREAALKQQLLTAASRRRNLLDVFADLGKKTPDSVREEILQVEKDEKIYHTALAKLDDEKALLDQQAESAKAFMATWAHVGDILAATSDEERAEILPLFVEAIVLMSAPAGRDFGTYSMHLQPELQGSATVGEKWEFSTDKEPDWSLPNRGSPLTGRALVCLSDQRAPPPGLEPGTRGLTVRCSTD